MTDSERQPARRDSLYGFAATVLRNRGRIAVFMLVGAVLAVFPVLTAPPLYRASTSFVPQGAVPGVSSLAAIAGQLGMSLPVEDLTQSPDFYVRLLKSRELLGPVVRDTFDAPLGGGARLTLLELFEIRDASATRREERGVQQLSGLVDVSVEPATSVVDVSVATRWPSVSLAIVRALIDGVDAYNQRTRQSQAAAERKFVEERLAEIREELRLSEDRLGRFLSANRDFVRSPQLTFEYDRLQRDLALKQQMVTSLSQAYEDARIREVRNIPVITVVEFPAVRSVPEPRGRLRRGVLGLALGLLGGTLIVFASASLARRRRAGDEDVREFFGVLDDLKAHFGSVVRRFRPRNE